MKKIILLILISIASIIDAQSNEDVRNLKKHYEAFEFSIVINKANSLLLHNGSMSDEDLTDIYMIKAASQFAVKEDGNSRRSFIELLKINSDYKINDVIYSPKLVNFFNEVKEEFLGIIKREEKTKTAEEFDKSDLPTHSPSFNKDRNSAIAKSLFIPGWGHLHLKNNAKGWILTTASTAVLGSMIYFILDANKKENNYLAETNATLIQQKYGDYNSSYKIRNLLIASYAAIWLYSQIDILFFSKELGSENISLNNSANYYPQNRNNIVVSFQIPF